MWGSGFKTFRVYRGGGGFDMFCVSVILNPEP